MRLSLALVVCALGAVALSGCASHRAALPTSRPVASGSAGSIESSDPRLAAALLAARLAPSAEAHLQVAYEYARLRILDAAHKRTAQALKSEPKFAAGHEMMARLWRDWGQPGTALVHAHRAIHYAPLSASAQNTLATILDRLGRMEEARTAYRQAIALDATAGWALSNLCYLEFREGRFEDARQHCEAALRVSPALTEAHNNLGLTYAASGDIAGAEAAFLATGDRANAHYNLGIVHLAAGHFVEAAHAFEAAIEARPGFTAAKSRAHEARMRAFTAENRKKTS